MSRPPAYSSDTSDRSTNWRLPDDVICSRPNGTLYAPNTNLNCPFPCGSQAIMASSRKAPTLVGNPDTTATADQLSCSSYDSFGRVRVDGGNSGGIQNQPSSFIFARRILNELRLSPGSSAPTSTRLRAPLGVTGLFTAASGFSYVNLG